MRKVKKILFRKEKCFILLLVLPFDIIALLTVSLSKPEIFFNKNRTK